MPDIAAPVRILLLSGVNLLILTGAFVMAVVAPMLLISLQSRKAWWKWLLAYGMLVLPFVLVVVIWAAPVFYWRGNEWLGLTLAHLPLCTTIVFTGMIAGLMWREARRKHVPLNRALPPHFFDDITHPVPPGLDRDL